MLPRLVGVLVCTAWSVAAQHVRPWFRLGKLRLWQELVRTVQDQRGLSKVHTWCSAADNDSLLGARIWHGWGQHRDHLRSASPLWWGEGVWYAAGLYWAVGANSARLGAGLGREGSSHGLDDYTELKYINFNLK